MAFEYDGEQHFRSVEHFGGQEGFLKQKERDARKERKCQENGYNLIRIAYCEDLNIDLVRHKIDKALSESNELKS